MRFKRARGEKRCEKSFLKRNLFWLVVIAIFLFSITLVLYTRLKSRVTLVLSSQVPATFQVGKVSATGLSARIPLKKGVYTARAYAPSCVEGVATFDLSQGRDASYRFTLRGAPEARCLNQDPTLSHPGFARNGGISYLGHRGSALIHIDRGGTSQDMTGDTLALVSSVNWSPDLDLALLRVDPVGEVLYEIGSPVACSESTTFLFRAGEGSFTPVPIRYPELSDFTPDGRSVVSVTPSSDGAELFSYELSSGDIDYRFKLPAHLPAPRVKVSPSGHIIAASMTEESTGPDSNLILLNILENEVIEASSPGFVTDFRFSPKGSYVLYESIDPSNMIPYVRAFSLYTRETTEFELKTYLTKCDFYSDTVVIAGLPHEIEDAISDYPQSTTPDSLIYSSVITGRMGLILPKSERNPVYYSHLSIDYENRYLTYSNCGPLYRAEVSGLLDQLREFASNQDQGSDDQELKDLYGLISRDPPKGCFLLSFQGFLRSPILSEGDEG